MAKDKKAKAADKKAKIAARQEKKAGKKEKKAVAKGKNADDSDADDVDIDAVLAEYARQQEKFLKVTETPCEPPKARGSSTLIASPANDNELFLFGGEYFNGALAHFFNDLFVYNIKNDEWKQVTSPNTPLPRSGHAWCRGGNAGGIYLFGGEFSSPKQGTFYHYNDFWRLDPGSREWTRLEFKGKGPPARSGHRMTYFKNYIILFGGFQDTAQQTKYLQDVWIYDCTSFTWHTPTLPPATGKPDARSSFTFLPHERGAVLYGGYSRVKATAAMNKQQQTKGSSAGGSRTVLKPVIHQDTWFLRITPPPADAPANTLPKVTWERRKRPVNPPNPPRAGATMAHHKGRGILFGGVHDVEESEEGIDSEFFNQLFVWNIERNRYFPLALRRPRAAPKKAPVGERGRRGRGRADEEELLRNLAALETKGKLSLDNDDNASDDERSAALKTSSPMDTTDPDAPTKPPKTVLFEFPHPRFNAQLAVQDDVLYIYGGTFEKGDREYTFDEMHAIDLGRLDGAKEIFRRDLDDWAGSDAESEDEDENEDSDEEMSDASDADMDKSDVASVGTAATSIPETAPPPTTDADEEEDTPAPDDGRPHPRPFESLRDFYARTGVQWQDLVIDSMNRASVHAQEAKSVKEIKKAAFERAEEKWWDSREEIVKLEDEQMEAGIGEVVSLADKDGVAGGGVGRRR